MYATITDRKLEIHDGIPTLTAMQEAVGGYIETAFRVPSSTRKNITVDVYCNEEGHLMSLPIDYVTIDGSPMAGPLVFTGGDVTTGDTVDITKDELYAALKQLKELPITMFAY